MAKYMLIVLLLIVAVFMVSAVPRINPTNDAIKGCAYYVYMQDPEERRGGRTQFEQLWYFHLGYRDSAFGHETIMWRWEMKARERLIFGLPCSVEEAPNE